MATLDLAQKLQPEVNRALGGNFLIHSMPGEGTRINARVPLHVVDNINTAAV